MIPSISVIDVYTDVVAAKDSKIKVQAEIDDVIKNCPPKLSSSESIIPENRVIRVGIDHNDEEYIYATTLYNEYRGKYYHFIENGFSLHIKSFDINTTSDINNYYYSFYNDDDQI